MVGYMYHLSPPFEPPRVCRLISKVQGYKAQGTRDHDRLDNVKVNRAADPDVHVSPYGIGTPPHWLQRQFTKVATIGIRNKVSVLYTYLRGNLLVINNYTNQTSLSLQPPTWLASIWARIANHTVRHVLRAATLAPHAPFFSLFSVFAARRHPKVHFSIRVLPDNDEAAAVVVVVVMVVVIVIVVPIPRASKQASVPQAKAKQSKAKQSNN
ncbi:hypothetical protein K504DRAFT_509938 [Pleomassaria siparia CBS 279.74]|uniref:Uncharacterized protein n=1 Tax=Pleomassaria siparia CBS 279.74 TaxID=1314801 RepID=A0A6G1KRH6_9PLEO|nr:hypothetical protein K504DRAFT_509938 [Pleomassaria siparia CBS 279.74]